MHNLIYVYPTLRTFKSKRHNYTFCSKKLGSLVETLFKET